MSQPRVLLLDENRGFGGAERHVVSLARELQARQLLAGVVGRKDSWLYKEAAKSLPFTTIGFRNEVDMFSVFSIYKLVKSSEANILHCIAHRDLVAAALARQLPGAPATVLLKAEHSFPDDDLSPLFRWAYRQCDGIASVSRAMQSALKEKLQTEADDWSCEFEVIGNGIELGPEPQAVSPSSPPHKYRVGVLSALRQGKGHRDFLDALAACPAEVKERLDVSIAGDGPLEQELRERAGELSLTVQFRGHQQDPLEYLRGLDLCVLPSHTETFSLVAVECLTLGVPLLAADSAGVCELYPEPDMLFRKGQPEELAARLESFLQHPQGYRQRAVELASRYRQEYSRERMGLNYQRFYEKLMAMVAT